MAAETDEDRLPQPSEQIHLPDPTYLPVIVAAGTTFALVGVVVNLVVLAIGVLIVAFGVVRWVRDTRRDISELPLEH